MLPSACANGFVKLFSGAGGVDTYPVSVSNLWQDATGTGIYAGKGIYDVAAFHARLDGALLFRRYFQEFLQDMVDKGEAGEAHCHFCGRRHTFTPGELQELLASAR